MSRRPEHTPGDAAPVTGTYELLNVFGSRTGVRVHVPHGQPLPPAPLRHTWTLADDEIQDD